MCSIMTPELCYTILVVMFLLVRSLAFVCLFLALHCFEVGSHSVVQADSFCSAANLLPQVLSSGLVAMWNCTWLAFIC